MPINQDYVKAFRYGMMFGKDIRPGTTPISIDVLDKDDILLAIKKAYIDMSPRTFKPKSDIEIDSVAKESLLTKIAEKIQSYMKYGLSNISFDEWHKKLCEFFLNGDATIKGLDALLLEAGKYPNQATFGKAQKIVNMTFKYMYCFDNADQYANKFEPCHIPLDSYILDWFFDCYKSEWEHPTNEKAKLTPTGTYRLTVWSELKYEKNDDAKAVDDNIPQYKEIQDWIKSRLDKASTPVSRLEAEFVIWYEARNDIRPYTY